MDDDLRELERRALRCDFDAAEALDRERARRGLEGGFRTRALLAVLAERLREEERARSLRR